MRCRLTKVLNAKLKINKKGANVEEYKFSDFFFFLLLQKERNHLWL